MHHLNIFYVTSLIRRWPGPRAGRLPVLQASLIAAFVLSAPLIRAAEPPGAGAEEPTNQAVTADAKDTISLRIVFDNYSSDECLEIAWGFACVINAGGKAILFDTGGDGAMLLRNLEKCGIDPKGIAAVVLSHAHGDHVAGLAEFLKINREVEVYLPAIFPAEFKDQVRQAGAAVVETTGPQEVCEDIWTTGVLRQNVVEQGIYIRTAEGIVVVTGCAHPGIVEIAEAAKAHAKEPVRFVLGGFHLVQSSSTSVEKVVRGLNGLEAKQVAPTHCTGDKARAQMKAKLGDRYVSVGAGSRLAFPVPTGTKESLE